MSQQFFKAKIENVGLILISAITVLIQIRRIWPTWDSVWLDEILTVSVASAPTISDLLRDSFVDGIPFGYYFVQFVLFKIGGFYLIKVTGLLIATYALYRFLSFLYFRFGQASAAIAAFFILQTDYLAIYLIELRPYGFLFLFSVLSLLLLKKVWQAKSFKNQSGLLYLLISIFGVSFHYTYCLVVLCQLLISAFYFQRRWFKPILAGCIVAVLSTPFLFRLYQMKQKGYKLWNFIQKPTGNFLFDLNDILVRVFESQYTEKEVMIFSALFIMAIAIFCYKRNELLVHQFLITQLLVGATVVPLLLYVISLNFQPLMIGRYFYYMFICFIAVISIGVGVILPRKLSLIFCPIIVLAGMLMQPRVHVYYNNREYEAELLQSIKQLEKPCLIATSENEHKFARGLSYLTGHLENPKVNSTMSANRIFERCQGAVHVAIVTFYPYQIFTQNLKEHLDKKLGQSTLLRSNSISVEFWKK